MLFYIIVLYYKSIIMSYFDFVPLIISVKLSFITTFCLIFFCIPIAYFIFLLKNRIVRSIIMSFFCLPLILPPTVLGFYLLIFIGSFFQDYLGFSLAFSFILSNN